MAQPPQRASRFASFHRLRVSNIAKHPHYQHERRRTYLNLSGEDAKLVTHETNASNVSSPGPEFSICGELVLSKDADPYFSLGEQALQHWRWSRTQGAFVRLDPPNELSRAFFRLPLYNSDGTENRAIVRIVSSFASYSCINLTTLQDDDEQAMGPPGATKRSVLSA